MKLKFLLVFFVITTLSIAQNGTVSGTVLDKELNNEPLPFANVSIKEVAKGDSTDANGKYTITLEPGSYTLLIAFLGYETKEIPFTIKAGENKIINETLAASGVQLEDLVINTTISQEKESVLLQQQQRAIEMKQAIGAQELSRKGISDAAAAVAKTTGVAKQEGVKNVFVRGLGDRYNSTSLNGLPLPSEDPRYKNIALDFFTTNVIKNINVNKTFTAPLYGDVSGANVDIASKELEKRTEFSVSLGSGFNTNASSNTVLVADGFNYFGFLENGKNAPISNLNSLNFDTSFKPLVQNNTINTNFSVSGGGKFYMGENEEQSVSLFAVVTSSSEFLYKEGKVASVNSEGGKGVDMDFMSSEYKASQTFLGNAKYRFGSGKSIAYNTVLVHDNAQTVGDYNGYTTNVNDNDEATNSFIRRQQVNNNNLWVNQLLFDYKFSEKINVNASAGYNVIRGSEPDRKTNSYDYRNGQYYVGTNSSALNHRFFSILDEDDVVGKLEGSYVFNPESELQKTLIVGANFRNTQRTFQSIQFNYDFPSNNVAVDIDNPEAVFNQENLNNNIFYLETGRGYDPSTAFNPYYYIADRTIVGGYTQFTYPVSEKLIFQAGLRFENIEQLINWDTNISSSVNNLTTDPAKIDKTYLLPSVNAKYSINDDKALRFAASQTYTLPQFKENAAFLYEDVNFSEFGNPYLIPSTNYNVDVKYDWFFSKTELISLGGFYKYIQDPINRIRVASAANELSYVNSESAFVTGAELEARKTLYSFATEESENANDLSFGLNMSYLYSEQKNSDTDSDNITVLFTNEKSKLQGATPLLINSDISYNFKSEKNALTSTLVFNYFYDKVYSIGTSENENIIEKSVPTLDFVNKFEFVKNKLTLNLALKNLLNPKYRLTQDTTKDGVTTGSVVQSYKKGMFISFGLNWNL